MTDQHVPDEIREAYARRLLRVSRDIELIARIGRAWLRDSQELEDLWLLVGSCRRLAEDFDEIQPPVLPDAWPPDDPE